MTIYRSRSYRFTAYTERWRWWHLLLKPRKTANYSLCWAAKLTTKNMSKMKILFRFKGKVSLIICKGSRGVTGFYVRQHCYGSANLLSISVLTWRHFSNFCLVDWLVASTGQYWKHSHSSHTGAVATIMLATVPRMQLSIATIASVVATRPKTVDRPNDPPSSSEKCENTSSQLTRSHVAAINARPVDET